ncbi:MAG: DMT family transporter, partial [candidate division Zixibacteria bacterium]|nr:DMT family transporter [candidate division Zixibacteria bacterium]
GEIFALSCALTWAIAIILWRKSGESVHPVALNLFKCVLAIVLIFPTMRLMGESPFQSAPAADYLILAVSGMLGIGIADTLLFMSLNRLGASLVAVVSCLYSPSVILLSVIWLGESLSVWQIAGTVSVISAVLLVSSPKARGHLAPKDFIWGAFLGVSAIICIAIGIVMVKPILERSSVLWVAQVRLMSGAAFLVIYLLLHRQRNRILSTLFIPTGWVFTLTGSFSGNYLSMIFWLAGMKFTQASIAAVLNQTSNIFVFILALIFLKEEINLPKVVAIGLAAAGAFLVTFG